MPTHLPTLRALASLVVVSIVVAPPSTRIAGEQLVREQETAPPPTHLEAVAFDAGRQRLVLFGGARIANGTFTDVNETWEWDGRRWYAIATAVHEPGARRAHALAYDPGERRVVLAGGVRTPDAKTDIALDDTWTYDGQRWAQGPTIPVVSSHALVYDATTRSMLLLGHAGRESPGPRRLAIWRRSPNGWSFADSTGPLVDGIARAAFDVKRSVLVVPVFQGSNRRVWEWDGTTWNEYDAPGPSPRSRYALAYDERSGRMILFGGRDNATRELLGDGWAWDGSRWSPLERGTSAPDARASASFVADVMSGRLVLYGGTSSRGVVTDLWVWSQSSWTPWPNPR